MIDQDNIASDGDYASFEAAARGARGVFLEDRRRLRVHRAIVIALVAAVASGCAAYAQTDPISAHP